jgi:hypothetical protein
MRVLNYRGWINLVIEWRNPKRNNLGDTIGR